jgi:acyl carrier protein
MRLTRTADEVPTMIADLLRLPADRVRDDTELTALITDSFMLVELIIDLQEELGVRFGQEDVQRVRTVADIVALVRERQAA